MEIIQMEDIKTQVDHPAAGQLILDVRSAEEFQEGHVPGAKNISHDEVSQHIGELQQFKAIYIYCRAGGRAMAAASDLKHGGLKSQLFCVTSGGMPQWEGSGFPVER